MFQKKIFYTLQLLLFKLIVNAQNEAYTLINLGKNINTDLSEISPYITPDGSKLFFVRADHPENTRYPEPGTQDIWYSKLNENNEWIMAKHLGYPFNTASKNTLIGQSSDGNVRYIKGYFKKGEFIKNGFSVSYLREDGWTDPQGILIPKYDKMSKKTKSVTNSLSASNNILLMSFSTATSDLHCIYVSFFKDNKWTTPLKLGKAINSGYGDFSAFLASDNVTLYFASYRPGGYGSADIYISKRLDDTWQNWSEPQNLGPDINSNAWDAYFTIPAKGDYFYMVKNNDIVKIKSKENQKPNPVVIVSGVVQDANTKKYIGATIAYYDLSTGQEVGVANSHPLTGEYTIVLPYGKNYAFKAIHRGYYSLNENLDLTNLSEYKELRKNLLLKPIETGQAIRINNIFFETDKSVLKPESFFELDNLVKLLLEHPQMQISILGHTDNSGSNEYNLKLSKARAQSVVDYLITKGITKERLSYEGYGETKPVSDNDTDEGKALNRRVEFIINKM
jgi:outer membrane protein OmpA-like peptidoglycan-associated protein